MTKTRSSELVRLELGHTKWLEGDCSFPADRSDFAVAYIHGFGSIRDGEKAKALAVSCANRNWPFAAFDFRGHGKSSGRMRDVRPSQLLEDLEAIRGFLTGRGVQRLCLVGSSMGGWAAAWFTLQHPKTTVGCALIAPALRFPSARWDRLTPEEREEWRRNGAVRITNEWVDAELGYGVAEEIPQFPHELLVEAMNTPTLIFHGLQDAIVPAAQSITFTQQAKMRHIDLHVFKDGDHRLTSRRYEIAEAACNFFDRLLHGNPDEVQLV